MSDYVWLSYVRWAIVRRHGKKTLAELYRNTVRDGPKEYLSLLLLVAQQSAISTLGKSIKHGTGTAASCKHVPNLLIGLLYKVASLLAFFGVELSVNANKRSMNNPLFYVIGLRAFKNVCI